MSREEWIAKIEFIIGYVLFGILLMFQYSRAFTYEETFLFIELLLTYFWTAGLIVYAKIRFALNVFEPIMIISILYEGIFILKPVVDLRTHSMVEHGIAVIGGGPKATLLFAVGFTVLFFSYYLRHRRNAVWENFAVPGARSENLGYSEKVALEGSEELEEGGEMPLQEQPVRNLPLLYGAWFMVYGLCIYCMLTQGMSLSYIFSFGSDGIRITDDSNAAMLFLSNFGVTMITLWLMILEYSTNKWIKVVTTAFGVLYIVMRNARWLMLTFILAPVVLFYIKRKKQPRILWLVLIGLGGLTVFAWMQVNRSVLAAGGAMQGWGKDGLTLEVLLAPLESDLSTYRTFYSMVERYPAQYPFLLGSTFLYVAILFVPRVFWPAKPDNPVRDIIRNSLNKKASLSGTAVANIGEFYANFGTVGIIGFMYLIGKICAVLKRAVFSEESRKGLSQNAQIAYAVSYPLLFQWIARGNFSGNFYMMLFAMFPILVGNRLQKKEKRA